MIPFGHLTAIAYIKGGGAEPQITGSVKFFPTESGTLVIADITGLPQGEAGASRIFAFHIHEGDACTGADFADTKGHYNPAGLPHPQHAGDLPPLFECHGRAFLAVLTCRFQVPEVVGRTVVIHSGMDDFTTQPSGNAGTKIACGVIQAV